MPMMVQDLYRPQHHCQRLFCLIHIKMTLFYHHLIIKLIYLATLVRTVIVTDIVILLDFTFLKWILTGSFFPFRLRKFTPKILLLPFYLQHTTVTEKIEYMQT
uniref:Uncharacterized protein n=1 Tax=Cacopsylla melanoneura TaxID=428564 RepID=A0A8D8XES0_9HEMI